MTHHLTLTPDLPPLAAHDAPAELVEAVQAWLTRSPSTETRAGYGRDLGQFLTFMHIEPGDWGRLVHVRPVHVSAWRDRLSAAGLSNAAVIRKLSVLRSLFGYLKAYGYRGPNPADTRYVAAPPVPRDGKTPGITPADCRRLIDAPDASTPAGLRDRALFAVLAYTGIRVGELCRLRVQDYQESSGHRLLQVRGKGGKERRVPLHPEAVERLETWLETLGRESPHLPLFRPSAVARSLGMTGFRPDALTRRAVQFLVKRSVAKLNLDPNVTVHSFRVTALTTARERGADIVDLQDFAGHADPRTTLAYIRNRDRLSRSPAYVLKY
jgi:integrase/recombinase XerD